MYTKVQFGKDLKRRVLEKEYCEVIGYWAHSVYVDWLDLKDVNFMKFLLHLGTMELGPEFAFSYEELSQIADDLIAGKEVKL
jgi:hypothetical protein